MSAEQVRTAVGAGRLAEADLRESTTPLGELTKRKPANQMRRNLKRFLVGNRLNLVGVIIVALFLFLSLFGRAVSPHDPYHQDITNSKLLAPSTTHLLGTDELGRDL